MYDAVRTYLAGECGSICRYCSANLAHLSARQTGVAQETLQAGGCRFFRDGARLDGFRGTIPLRAAAASSRATA